MRGESLSTIRGSGPSCFLHSREELRVSVELAIASDIHHEGAGCAGQKRPQITAFEI
jgi:hypothetical protein